MDRPSPHVRVSVRASGYRR